MKYMNKFIGLILLLVVSVSFAEMVGFTGTTPTHRENGDALGLSEIAGFHIHCGTTQGDYQGDVFIEGATLPDTAWDLDLPVGNHFCVVTTQDIDGRNSAYSNEVAIVIEGKSRPNPPMIQQGTVIRIVVTLP